VLSDVFGLKAQILVRGLVLSVVCSRVYYLADCFSPTFRLLSLPVF